MPLDLSRRSFFRGFAASALAAPAIVRAASLMPVRGLPLIIKHECVFRTSLPADSWRILNQGMPPYGDIIPYTDIVEMSSQCNAILDEAVGSFDDWDEGLFDDAHL